MSNYTGKNIFPWHFLYEVPTHVHRYFVKLDSWIFFVSFVSNYTYQSFTVLTILRVHVIYSVLISFNTEYFICFYQKVSIKVLLMHKTFILFFKTYRIYDPFVYSIYSCPRIDIAVLYFLCSLRSIKIYAVKWLFFKIIKWLIRKNWIKTIWFKIMTQQDVYKLII